jgi:putative sigma-54 modulation protein
MQKRVTARHFDLTPEMKSKAEEEMDGLTRFFDRIVSAEFILDAERHRRMAELHVKVSSTTLTGTGETDDIYSAMGQAVDRVVGQLKKYKGKLKERKPEEISELSDALTQPSTDVDELDV